jgi:antitoxin Xre/MbcA/ParS-like protein
MATALDRAVEVKDVVAALATVSLTQADVAQGTGASERSVRNWKRTSAIRPEYEERLQDIREIALILQDCLTSRGIGQWFRARNRSLGGRRPIELMSEGEADAVRRAAHAFVDGAYV